MSGSMLFMSELTSVPKNLISVFVASDGSVRSYCLAACLHLFLSVYTK